MIVLFLKIINTFSIFILHIYVCVHVCRYIFITAIYPNPGYNEKHFCIFLKLIGFPTTKLGLLGVYKPC